MGVVRRLRALRLTQRRPGFLPGLALVALTCLSFLPAVWSSFVSDDLLLLYAVIVLEVWALASRVADPWRAWIAAAAFAVYPRHGESVAWVSGNNDLTAVAAGLGALLCATARRPLAARVLGAATLTAVATLCKEIAFVLPALAVLLLWRRGGRRSDLLIPAAMLAVEAGTTPAGFRLASYVRRSDSRRRTAS